MLVWATMNDPSVTNQTVYDPETWDQIGVKLWDSATKNDKVVAGLLSPWPAISEALKSHVGPQSETCGLPDSEEAAGLSTDPPATPSAHPPLLPSQAFAVMPPDDLGNHKKEWKVETVMYKKCLFIIFHGYIKKGTKGVAQAAVKTLRHPAC